MKPIDPKQLEKDINAIPSICEDGKKAIKQLFEHNFEVKFEQETPFVLGGVYSKLNYAYWLCTTTENQYRYICRGIDNGRGHWGFPDSKSKTEVIAWLKDKEMILEAKSLSEYFQSKGA